MDINYPTLPHATEELFLTDGGLETTLVFLQGFDLPCFAAFDLLKDGNGREVLRQYYRNYLKIAKDYKTNFILESPTWRANPDWITRIGYPESALEEFNITAVDLMNELRHEFQKDFETILISGCIGPRGDGYRPENKMSVLEAEKYHAAQAEVFSRTPADMISAITMNYAEEAAGIARAAAAVQLPAVISFTVETDGRLVTGMSLKDAISFVDDHSDDPPIYYMINCAHPTHFIDEMEKGRNEYWVRRIRGIRANASCRSHEELDNSTTLDRGEPVQFGREHKRLKEIFGHLNVFGGCCGSDEEHVLEIIQQLKAARQ